MGACSTIRVTSKSAKRYLVDHILYDVSTSELADLLDIVLRSQCYNAIVVAEGEENDDEVIRRSS